MPDCPAGEHPTVCTIGHSSQPIDAFIELLKIHGIRAVADVRSSPYSQYAPQFNAEPVKAAITAAGIRYAFLGHEIGGRPTGPEFYDDAGYVLYWRLAQSAPFLHGIERLLNGIRRYRTAVMCSEENPIECHRRLLIGRVLAGRGVQVLHIRHDGRIQTEDDVAGEEKAAKRDSGQLSLFEVEVTPEWKSTRSVLHAKQQPNSSEH